MFGVGAMGLVMLLFWGGLIVGAVLLTRVLLQVTSHNQPEGREFSLSTPREILDQRYARGELTREEYETMRNDIQS